VQPIVEYIDEKPMDIAIALDRGARLIAPAVLATWRQKKERSFPAIDRKIHFARINKSRNPSDIEHMQKRVCQIIEQAQQTAKQRDGNDRRVESVLVIDDWVVGQTTQQVTTDLFEAHGITPSFAVLCGGPADVICLPNRSPALSLFTTWRNNPEQLGIHYANSGSTEYPYQQPIPVMSRYAIGNRQAITQAAAQLH
jgi:hypothetical protein